MLARELGCRYGEENVKEGAIIRKYVEGSSGVVGVTIYRNE